MNILPKKRWHVRTRENIARVRRDEAQAAEEEKEKERKAKLAEKEARAELLRVRARARYSSTEVKKEETGEEEETVPFKTETTYSHVNLFEDLEAGIVSSTAVNKEHEEEKKQEREKYEKQIGYLTYLGQDTVESTGKVSWYNKCPDRATSPADGNDEEAGLKNKMLSDPLSVFRKFCTSTFSKKSENLSKKPDLSKSVPVNDLPAGKSEMKSKKRKRYLSHSSSGSEGSPSRNHKKRKQKHKKSNRRKSSRNRKHSSKRKAIHRGNESHSSNTSNSESDNSDEDEAEKKKRLAALRAERLRREKEEKKKADKLLAKINGVDYIDDEIPPPKPPMKQRYNSQFNPFLAKQNYDDQRYRFET